MEDLAQQIPISLTGQVGEGGKEGSSDPQHAPLTASEFTFHTASRVTGEPLRMKFAVGFKAMPDRNLGSAVCVSELQPARWTDHCSVFVRPEKTERGPQRLGCFCLATVVKCFPVKESELSLCYGDHVARE